MDHLLIDSQNLFDKNQSPLVIEDRFDIWGLFQDFMQNLDVRSENTKRTYKVGIKAFLKWLSQKGINLPQKSDVILWKKEMREEGKSSATINSYLLGIRRFFDYLEEMQIYKNIAQKVKVEKIGKYHKRDYLTVAQSKMLLASIDRTTIAGLRDYAMMLLMLTCGLRDSEVVGTNVEDLRTSGEAVLLFIKGKGHSEKDDFVIVSDLAEIAIRSYLKEREKYEESDPLFIGHGNRNSKDSLTTKSLSRMVKKHLRAIGLDSKRYSAHSLRHTAATLNLINGGSLEETQNLLRHSNIQTTMIYAHHIDSMKNKSSQRINDLFL
jgi:Site-specific recombinase XerD